MPLYRCEHLRLQIARPLCLALAAEAGDDQAVAGGFELVLAGDGVHEAVEFATLEFNELVTPLAMKMVVK